MTTRSIAEYNHAPRALGLVLGFLTLATTFVEQRAPAWFWIGPLLHALVWPRLALKLARRSSDPNAVEKRNLLVDHFACGLWTVAMSLSVLPCVLMLTLISMDSVFNGGRNLLTKGLAASAVGVVFGLLLFGPRWHPDASMLQVLGCLPVLVAHPIAVSYLAGRMVSRLRRQRAEYAELMVRDPLSGLFNRRHFDTRIREEFARVRRGGTTGSLALIDFDHFKDVNDTLGHQAGDEAIQRFAARLQQNLRASDVAARYGGEEFAVLLPDTLAADASALLRRVQACLAATPLLEARAITISVGVAELTPDYDRPEAWVRVVDQMMYRAKHLGRDRVVVAGERLDGGTAPAGDASTRSLESRLPAGLELAGIAAALFDPSDRLVWSNRQFRTLYAAPPEAASFGDVIRHCHAHGVGVRVQAASIEPWLAAADAKRRSRPHRSFVIDTHAQGNFRVEEISMSDGWMLNLWLPAPAATGETGVTRLVEADASVEAA